MDPDWTILDPPLNPYEFGARFPGEQHVGLLIRLQVGAMLGYKSQTEPIREILIGDVNAAWGACGCCDPVDGVDLILACRRVWTRAAP